jgi:hypothetical protein
MYGLETIVAMNAKAAPVQAARKARSLPELEKAGKAKKSDYFAAFDGSERLFNTCWREYTDYVKANGKPAMAVRDFINDCAKARVNNPHSSFYMLG